ncbi:hypothetical protein [Streptomyces sp. NPDC059862]|uniref:hypothetical protein n=1 Tax=unclassified Streptomyces TaxID=2593676 RepID=UPI0036360A90
MTTNTKTHTSASNNPVGEDPDVRQQSGRGRHRRPRPRKVLFAVGGLALAAGALSLVRMTSESGGDDLGTAQAAPGRDPVTGSDRATTASATVADVPDAGPSAGVPLGGADATPSTGTGPAPLLSATTSPTPPATSPAASATSSAPSAPGTTEPPRPPAPTTSAPQPTPTPTPSSPSPAPQPDQPGLCVPVIGLCVDTLSD